MIHSVGEQYTIHHIRAKIHDSRRDRKLNDAQHGADGGMINESQHGKGVNDSQHEKVINDLHHWRGTIVLQHGSDK